MATLVMLGIPLATTMGASFLLRIMIKSPIAAIVQIFVKEDGGITLV